MEEYTHCDQCIRGCPVSQLRCENGRKHYFEVTGKEYKENSESKENSGDAYRRKIRERRAKRNSQK